MHARKDAVDPHPSLVMFIFKELIPEASEVTHQAKVFTTGVWQTSPHREEPTLKLSSDLHASVVHAVCATCPRTIIHAHNNSSAHILKIKRYLLCPWYVCKLSFYD